jgi:hypothetical protein
MTTDTAVHKLMCGAPMSTPLGISCALFNQFAVDNSVDKGMNCLCAPHKGKTKTQGAR